MLSVGLLGQPLQKNIHSIKTRINQVITTQALQKETLVHIVSILNITRYATQVNRCGINALMDAVRATSHDINNLYNLTTSLATSINFHQLILHIRSVFANLCNSLNYIWMVSTDTMDYIDTAITGTLSPSHLTCCGFTENATKYSRYPTTYTTPTNFTRRYLTFLQIPTYSSLNREQTVSATSWHAHSG